MKQAFNVLGAKLVPTFPKQTRLRKRADFLRVKGECRKLHSKAFLLQVVDRKDDGPTRLGVTVSSQVGVAVRRVRIKRLIREVFRLNRDSFPAHSDIVVIAKTGCAVENYKDVCDELFYALRCKR